MGAPVVTEEEANKLILSVPAWKREFHFVEFKDAFAFTYKIANLSERENHHPGILTECGKVTVYWWTHKINGLHINDFIMAAKTDMLAKLSQKS